MADVMLWKLLKISVPTEPSSGKYVVQVVHVVPLPHFFTCAGPGQVGPNFFGQKRTPGQRLICTQLTSYEYEYEMTNLYNYYVFPINV